METTWRARPLAVGRLAFALLTMLLVIALGATAVVVGSRLMARPVPDDGRLVVAPIPQGPEAVLAFSYREPGSANGDIFTVRLPVHQPRAAAPQAPEKEVQVS